MRNQAPALWAPIRINKLELRNRIVLTGHGTGMGYDFKPNDQLVAYYAERAKGGVGLIMLGSQQVHPTSPGITNLLCNYDDGIIAGLRRVANAVHAQGGRIFGYLSHMGLASSARPLPLWSASAVYEQRYGEVGHAITEAEMADIVESFQAGALRNLSAGLDGIEVHCGHGLLLNQFLSPLTNKRRDRYGGELENRVRFPAWVLRDVRAAIGPDVPLGIRCSGDELIDGGLTLDDMRAIIPALVEAGALDYVDVSAGNDGDPVSNMLHEPPKGLPAAPFRHLARGIREVVQVPIIHGTRIKDARHGDQLLVDGDADLVGMCRALIADPHLPNKVRDGRSDEVVPCIGCEQACIGRLMRVKHASCFGNPVTGREREWAEPAAPAAAGSVVVIGAGPAGMEAAAAAARRGRRVVLFEAGEEPGGQLRLAATVPQRQEWADLLHFQTARLARLGVELRVGVAEVVAEQPDSVILATGARPTRPAIPGADAPHVFTIHDVLQGARLGRRVLVIDHLNRQPGLTTACLLADAGYEVAIMTEAPHDVHKLESQNLAFAYRRLFAAGARFMPHLAVCAISDQTITARNVYTGEDAVLGEWDAFVVATPGAAVNDLQAALQEAVPDVQVVGDAYAPRDVEAAILEGHRAWRAA